MSKLATRGACDAESAPPIDDPLHLRTDLARRAHSWDRRPFIGGGAVLDRTLAPIVPVRESAGTFQMSKTALIALAVVAAVVLVPVGCSVSTYNGLVGLDQQVQSQWAQVENTYQRRADLIPNLVETVKGAAAFEKDTFTAVTEARSRVGQAPATRAPDDPAALEKYQKAQEQLSGALSRLMVVVERYPDLKATQAFRDLQAQLEGTENRINVERMRFNEAAQAFNTKRNSFPTVLLASAFGDRFKEKGYFRAEAGAEKAPKVAF